MCFPALPVSLAARFRHARPVRETRKHIALLAGLLLPALALGGCVQNFPVPLETGSADVAACRAFFTAYDDAVEEAGARDHEAVPVPGFPYLRKTRLLSSFRHEAMNEAQFEAWVEALQSEAALARKIELANLPAPARLSLGEEIAPHLNACAERLAAHDLEREEGRALLKERMVPPRHYDDWVRAAGIYPLSSLGVAAGFERWKAANLPSFDLPPEEGISYGPSAEAEGDAATLLSGIERDALGLWHPAVKGVEALAPLFAPQIIVTEESEADIVGTPYLDKAGSAQVDTARHAVFVRFAQTRWNGKILPQLVYTFWFKARPKEGAFDILGGPLDALMWRVTLDEKGRPLIYDTAHACGCYHLFFPVPPAARRPVPADKDLREAPLVPRAAPMLEPGERLALHLAASSHYLRQISVTKKPSQKRYDMVMAGQAPEYGLRSLPVPDSAARRSFYGEDGIIARSARAERFLLWPMGIQSAGAMRQWGTHATAFVGERHFDDAFLFEEAFDWEEKAE